MAKSRQPAEPEELAIPLWLWWFAVGVAAVLLIVTFEFGYAVGEKRVRARAEAATEVAAVAKPSGEHPPSPTPSTPTPKISPKPPVAIPVKPPTPKVEPEPVLPKPKEPPVEVPSPKIAPEKPPPPPEPVLVAKPTFAANILPVFQTKCVSCHGGLSKKAGLDVRTIEAMIRGGKNGTVLKPGKLETSPLWASVESGEMPPSNKPQLTADEKKMIRDWIIGGAK